MSSLLSRGSRLSTACRAIFILVIMIYMAIISDCLFADDFVLLTNGNVIRGKATSIGSHVVIDRGDGNELRLAANQVSHCATTLLELYRYRQQQNRRPGVDSYQDNARWCFRNELYDEMKLALDAAELLDPTHPETLRLQRQLASVTNVASDIQQIGSQSTPSPGRAVISITPEKPSRPQAAEASEAELAKANLSFQAVAYFSNRVQPLLINRCGNTGCHRTPTNAQWQLTHMGAHVRPPSRMTKINLLSTLAIVSRESSQESELLKFATTPHGGKDDAPLKRGDDSSIGSLNEWIIEVSQGAVSSETISLTELPELSNQAARVDVKPLSTDGSVPKPGMVGQVAYLDGEVPMTFDELAGKQAISSRESNTSSPSGGNRPMRLPTVENPFDPDIFNRYYRSDPVASNRDK